MEKVELGKLVTIRTGKLDANASSENGKFPFFTCSVNPLKISSYSYDCECVLVAGNGDLNVKYYNGKFDAYQRTYIIESNDKNILDVRYLYRFMSLYITVLRTQTIGGVIKYIKLGNLTQALIPLPDLESQKKIVETLEKAELLILKRQSQITALDELAKSTFLEMFGDPKENKNQYPVRSLVDFYESQKDGVKCGPFGSALKKDEYTNCGTPVWNMDNITKSNSFIDQPNLFVSEEKAIQLRSYNVQNGDIIISRAGTVGKMGVVRSKYKNSLISTNLIRLRLNKELIPEFLVVLVGIFGDKVCRMRTGSEGSFTHMNTSVLNSMEFPVPPLEKQKQFIKFLESIEEQNLKFMDALNEMQFLYNSLLQKAFRGELIQEK